MNKLQAVLDELGYANVGMACGVTRQAVKQWWLYGKLPDSEWLCSTHKRRTRYAAIIAKMAGCNKNDLL